MTSMNDSDDELFNGPQAVVVQIGDRPLYLGNDRAAGADCVVHEKTSKFAAGDVPVLSVNMRECPLTTHHHPLHDGSGNDQAAFEAAMDCARELYEAVLGGDRPGPMLVNCAAGISRSTTTIAVLIATTEEVSFRTAVQTVRTYRERVRPHPALVELAQAYLNDTVGAPLTSR